MAVDHDRRPEDDIDRSSSYSAYDASGWGVVLGVAAVLAILGMLFVGMGNNTPSGTPTTTQPGIERSAPTPTPTPTPAPQPQQQ